MHNVKPFGIYVEPRHLNFISENLDELGINYHIWNAEEVLKGTAEKVEFNVNTERELDIIKTLLAELEQS